jgi:hypothetical protein
MKRLAVLVALLSLVPCAARAEVRLTMHDGVVSLTATDATVRQILAEWARVGQTKIVNGDKVAGGPISLQLVEVSEEQALDVILRTVSGYLAAPRLQTAANLSRFDRILITPTSVPVATAPARVANPPAPNRFQQVPSADADDDAPLPNAPPPAPPLSQRAPIAAPRAITAPPPSSEPVSASPPPYNPSSPDAPVGVSTPGMIVQPAQQPGQAGAQTAP